MTNKEALQSIILCEVSNNLIDKQLIDCVIDGDVDYTASMHDTIELCSAYIYKLLVTNPDFTQGSYSISNSQSAEFKKLANSIFKKNDLLEEVIGTKIKGFTF